jgi:hypothetical protein
MLALESSLDLSALGLAWYVAQVCASFALGAFVLRAVATRVEARALRFVDAFGYVAGSTILGAVLAAGALYAVITLEVPVPEWLLGPLANIGVAALLYALVRRYGRFAPRASLMATVASTLAMFALGFALGG